MITAGKLSFKSLLVDREIGPVTLKVFNNLPAEKLNAEINAERETAYRLDNGFSEWGKIWERRLKQYT